MNTKHIVTVLFLAAGIIGMLADNGTENARVVLDDAKLAKEPWITSGTFAALTNTVFMPQTVHVSGTTVTLVCDNEPVVTKVPPRNVLGTAAPDEWIITFKPKP